MLVEEGLDEAKVVGVESSEVWATEVEVGVFLVAVLISVVLISVEVCVSVLFLDGEDKPSGQKVISRLALSSWQATWTQVSSGCLKAVLQPGELHVVPNPSQPP